MFSNGYRRDLDLPWIRWVSRKSNTRHHYIILSAEDMIGALFEAEEASGVPGYLIMTPHYYFYVGR